ncbi:MAG: hypothetical protein M1824_004053 [Vezdaea acicularis]|nr:MAG: hypothetical protein M1824_004053 [Vezdaea acicularis]
MPIQPYSAEIPSSQISPDPRKRPRASMEAPMTVGTPLQPLQPRPPTSTFNPLNGDDPLQGSPEVYDPNQPAKKKRGRPTKAEAERRKHEAEARGEPYPPPKTPKAPKAPKPEIGARSSLGSAEGSGLGEVSFSGAQTPIMTAEQSPVQQPAEAPETGSASKRKRPRPSKSETEEHGATKEPEILTSAGPSPRTEAPPDPVPPSLSTPQGPPPLLHAHPERVEPVVRDVPMTGTETAPTVAFSQPPSTTNTQA